jgi:hypothetical protein
MLFRHSSNPWLFGLTLVLIAMSVTGCVKSTPVITSMTETATSPSTEPYSTYTNKWGRLQFSLDYPEGFKLVNYFFPATSDNVNTSGYVNFYGMDLKLQEETTIRIKQQMISVSVSKQSETIPNAITDLERTIESNSRYPGFHVIERYTTEIDGFQSLVLRYKITSRFSQDPYPQPIYSIDDDIWTFYFDHNGYIWSVTVSYPIEYEEQAKTDFDHIIQTFQILN